MDMRRDGAPGVAADASRMPMRFEGSGTEYFKIWIVNLALTVLTLGIFSAWAKVRNKRYFLGNTYLAAHSFDYHGSPWRILLGRLVALVLLAGYLLSTNFGGPLVVGIWFILFLAALPLLITSSLRFNTRNTSYRNLRFDFSGRYGGALWAFLFWPFLATVGIGVLLYPLGHRARLEYQINNLRFGGRAFLTDISAKQMFSIYLAAIPEFLVLASLLDFGIGTAAPHLRTVLNMLPDPVIYYILFSLPFVAALFLVYPVVKAVAFNMAVNETSLEGGYLLDSTLTPWRIAGVAASNLALTLATLGLFHPWAKVRMARYVASGLIVTGPADLLDALTPVRAPGGAFGEEAAGFLGVDIGF